MTVVKMAVGELTFFPFYLLAFDPQTKIKY